jgi:phosphoribosylglycinamide formyltransferase-1
LKRVGILSSYNGSGFIAIQEAIECGKLDAKVVVVISNNSDANILKRADKFGIDNFIINSKSNNETDEILETLKKYKCDYIFLSGYMKKIPPSIIKEYPKNIINSHPALLPKFGGKGMYGRNIHQAVYDANEKVTGSTIHFVNELYDDGEIILQKSFEISKDDSVDSIEDRVKELEQEAIVEALQKVTR